MARSEIEHRRVVLIGMMGAGKTTVGRMLAAHLGWKFWDNDEALEKATGMTAQELQRRGGRAALHEAEDRLLREALRTCEPTVFAAPGSVVLDPGALEGTYTIWLRASAESEASNILGSGQQHRPLGADAAAVLQRLAAERQAGYGDLADVTVDVGADPYMTYERVLGALAASPN